MNALDFPFAGRTLTALPTGALWDRVGRVLCVSDMHMGKTARIARRAGLMLPPYEVAETLGRLAADIAATDPALVICLGDSFDDIQASREIAEADRSRLAALQAGRTWIWIEGNHDPGPTEHGGEHRDSLIVDGLTYRHIAEPGERAEISGHYHPKHGLRGSTRPCFLFDAHRLIMPAYGTYTGGLPCTGAELTRLLPPPAFAILTGPKPILVPVSKRARSSRPYAMP